MNKQELFENYTRKSKIPESEEYNVYLSVDVQHFCVATAESAAHANWFRERLADALYKILNENEISKRPGRG